MMSLTYVILQQTWLQHKKKGLANIKWGLTNNDIYSFNINSCDVTNKKWV